MEDHIQKLMHAYNCTTNSSTGYNPCYLLFGHKPILLIDLLLPVPPSLNSKATNNLIYLTK